jgi:hypothetical protein
MRVDGSSALSFFGPPPADPNGARQGVGATNEAIAVLKGGKCLRCVVIY